MSFSSFGLGIMMNLRLPFAGVVFRMLLLKSMYPGLSGSLTNLSGRLMQLITNEKEVSIICQIEPFHHNKCHRWYRETADGNIELVAEGSVEFDSDEKITPGHVYTPINKENYHTPNNTCQDSTDPEVYTADNLTAFYATESFTDDGTENGSENDIPDVSIKYFALRHDTFYILTITDLKLTDEGKYFCQYTCDYCDSLRTQLQFIVPATQERITLTSSPDTEFVDIDQVVSLTCTIVSRPQAEIRWILVLNHEIVPHIEETEPAEVNYDNKTDLYTVKAEFHFRGGHVTSNPMRIYCQVLSPVLAEAIIDHTVPDLIESEGSDHHNHSRKKRASAAEKNASHDHSEVSSMSATKFGHLYYAFESTLGHHQSDMAIDYQYLTTMVFKRRLYRLPTAALDGRWRLALIIISSFVLLLPVAIGLIQILCNKSSGVSYSLLGDDSIHDYYKIAEAKSYTLNSDEHTESINKL